MRNLTGIERLLWKKANLHKQINELTKERDLCAEERNRYAELWEAAQNKRDTWEKVAVEATAARDMAQARADRMEAKWRDAEKERDKVWEVAASNQIAYERAAEGRKQAEKRAERYLNTEQEMAQGLSNALQRERDLKDIITRVSSLHVRAKRTEFTCRECGDPLPCPTLLAIQGEES